MEAVHPTTTENKWLTLAHELGKEFAERSSGYDLTDSFVSENYDALKKHVFFSAMIPEEFGGGGLSHAAMCDIIRTLAYYDSSTALALSMHQHLLGANIWKYKHGKGGEAVLQKVADQQLILISTGARDWLESNGTMEKVEGGFRVSAQKHFASQSAVGHVLVTSAPYHDPEEGWQVLHFSVPMNAEGVSKEDNWYTLGMRGTGSQTVTLENVFVPESAIVLRRPQGEYHMFWNVILTVALPLIMSVYVGVAERAAQIALINLKSKKPGQPHTPYLVGEMNNELTTAQVMLQDMIRLTNNFDFAPTDENGHEMLTRKTIIANSAIRTVNKSMEAVGGQSFFRAMDLERLFRDVQAGVFHPLPEKQQQHFSGEFLLREDSV
uniref:Acyl-CoA/acyl-ACP dehydrogenase n=1 Tax=Roseihalotalea indica TaxID=2867963 RepID=A0AA49JDU2_9BACT|nr:acyl-CoA/acyl-ACP dehydrogenase [Tunicatimonas sp. TK19036]